MSNYIWDAERYSKTAEYQDNIALQLIEKSCTFRKNDKIMDIGCGDGAVTREISKLVPNGFVTGIEPDKNMLSHSIKNSKLIKNISFIQKKACELDFDEKYDWILSFVALHWEVNLKEAFQCIHKSLVKGGTFLATMVPFEYPLHPCLFALFKSEKWSKYFYNFNYGHQFYDTGGCRILLNQCGFKINELYWHYTETRMTKEQIIENFCSWGPLFKIPKNLKNDFLEDFFMNFSEMLPPPVDEKYPYPIRLIYIKASK
jgi:trans-aconitate methyltransferase